MAQAEGRSILPVSCNTRRPPHKPRGPTPVDVELVKRQKATPQVVLPTEEVLLLVAALSWRPGQLAPRALLLARDRQAAEVRSGEQEGAIPHAGFGEKQRERRHRSCVLPLAHGLQFGADAVLRPAREILDRGIRVAAQVAFEDRLNRGTWGLDSRRAHGRRCRRGHGQEDDEEREGAQTRRKRQTHRDRIAEVRPAACGLCGWGLEPLATPGPAGGPAAVVCRSLSAHRKTRAPGNCHGTGGAPAPRCDRAASSPHPSVGPCAQVFGLHEPPPIDAEPDRRPSTRG